MNKTPKTIHFSDWAQGLWGRGLGLQWGNRANCNSSLGLDRNLFTILDPKTATRTRVYFTSLIIKGRKTSLEIVKRNPSEFNVGAAISHRWTENKTISR